jgi:hypothetical protein
LATSIEDFLGTWFSDGDHAMYLQFDSDGTCPVAVSQKRMDSDPNVECICSFEGTQMTIACNEAKGIPSCPGDAVYEVQLLPNGNIKFLNVKDPCAPRIRTMVKEHYLVP